MGAAIQAAKSRKSGATPEINVTPLVDVVLVLLIIFMVVTPALNEGAGIELPQVTTPDSKPKQSNPIEVTIAPDGTTLLEQQKIEPSQLKGKLVELHQQQPERTLVLTSDQGMRWGRMRSAFLELQQIGFKGVRLKVIEKKPARAGGGA